MKQNMSTTLVVGLMIALGGCMDKGAPTSFPLTGYPAQDTSTPSFSPTSDVLEKAPTLSGQVVFHNGENNAHNIYVVDLATLDIRQLTAGGDNIEPKWSPDGTQITYGCKTGNYFGICLMNADGSNVRQLVSGSFNAWGPDWSPDGSQLVFVSSEESYAHLYIVSTAGGTPHRLLRSPGNEGGPHWAPDGSRIIFMSDRNNFNIYTVRPDGSDEQQLTAFGRDDRPNWSVTGEYIALRREVVSSSTFSGNEIVVMDAKGQNEQQLTSDTYADDWPTFSPDGKWLLYSVLRNGVTYLQVIPVTGGQAAPLADGGLPGNAPDWKP